MERSKGEKGAQQSRPKACLGALFFTQSRYDREKPPICAGLPKRLRGEEAAGPLPTDSIPGGDFRYMCVGYSAYDPEAMKQAARKRTSNADPVQLPYCEGLEVVSAAAMGRKPELLTDGPPGAAAAASTSAADRDMEIRQRKGRSFWPGGASPSPGGMDWDRFKERFDITARRIAEKMASNAAYMGKSAKRSWEELRRELSGDDGDGDQGRRGS